MNLTFRQECWLALHLISPTPTTIHPSVNSSHRAVRRTSLALKICCRRENWTSLTNMTQLMPSAPLRRAVSVGCTSRYPTPRQSYHHPIQSWTIQLRIHRNTPKCECKCTARLPPAPLPCRTPRRPPMPARPQTRIFAVFPRAPPRRLLRFKALRRCTAHRATSQIQVASVLAR